MGNSYLSTFEVVEVDIYSRRRVNSDVNCLVANDIARNDGSMNWRAAIAAVDVDSDRTRSRSVTSVGEILRYHVADNLIVVYVIGRQPEGGPKVRMDIDPA